MNQERGLNDLFLQIIFVIALIVVIGLFYWSRILGIQASQPDSTNSSQYENSSAFELERAEQQTEARIKILKADYANEILLYKQELNRISNSTEWSELEKREKLGFLKEMYSDEHFNTKQDLINQEYRKLENIKRVECAKFCDISNL